MNENNFTNNYTCIQIGYYKLKHLQATTYQRIKKTSKEDNLYSDGDTNFNYKNYYQSIEVDCLVKHIGEEDENGLLKTLNEDYLPIFFVKKERFNGYDKLRANVKNGEDRVYQIYVTYGRCEFLPDNQASMEAYGNNIRTTNFKVVCIPKLWRCDEYISVLKTGKETELINYLWGGGKNWADPGFNWGTYNTLFDNLSSLQDDQRDKLFQCENCPCPKLQNLLIWNDIYVRPNSKWKTKDIISLPTNNVTALTISNSNIKYINTSHNISSIRENTETIVEISTNEILPAMAINSLIAIKNINNNSGFKIVWKNATCPSKIQVRYDGNSIFDVSTENLVYIEPENNYTIEAIGDYNEGLYFDGTYPIDLNIKRITYNQLVVETTSTFISSTDYNIKIYSYFTNI